MATYVPALKGYVTDVPELWLKRKDDKVFHFDQLSSSNVSPDTQFTEVNGGWSLYPVAYLPGQSTMEMTFESAQFDADLFALATNTEFKDDKVEVWGHAEVDAEPEQENSTQSTFIIESEDDLTGAKFYINGYAPADGVAGALTSASGGDSETGTAGATVDVFEYTAKTLQNGDNPQRLGLYVNTATEQSATPVYVLTTDTEAQSGTTYYEKKAKSNLANGVNTVAGFDVLPSEADESTGTYKTKIILATSGTDIVGLKKGERLSVDWYREETLSTIQVDNQQTFVGEAMLKWPVYSSGEEIKAAGIKGYMLMHIYKCRCTAMPGFDTSYKSAVTNGITLSAMDPHRHDGAIYSMSFLEK